MLLKQITCVSEKFKAQKKLSNIFLFLRDKSSREKGVWSGNVLLLSQCSMKKVSERKELIFVRDMVCVMPLIGRHESPQGVSLQWATVGPAEKWCDLWGGK